MIGSHPRFTLFPYTTLYRSNNLISRRSLTCEPVGRDSKAVIADCRGEGRDIGGELVAAGWARPSLDDRQAYAPQLQAARDRKSTRLNSRHANISYAVFCLKK